MFDYTSQFRPVSRESTSSAARENPLLLRRRQLAIECNERQKEWNEKARKAKAAGYGSIGAQKRAKAAKLKRIAERRRDFSWNVEKNIGAEGKKKYAEARDPDYVGSLLEVKKSHEEIVSSEFTAQLLPNHQRAMDGMEAQMGLLKKRLSELDNMVNEDHISRLFETSSMFAEPLELEKRSKLELSRYETERAALSTLGKALIASMAEEKLAIAEKFNMDLAKAIDHESHLRYCRAVYKRACQGCGVPSCKQIIEQIGSGTIALSFYDVNSDHAKSLSFLISISKTLSTFLFADNAIGPEGCVAIADALLENTSISCIDLSRNKVGETGCVALLEAVRKGSGKVQDLSLASNRIVSNSNRVLETALHNCLCDPLSKCALVKLDLSCNKLDERCIAVLGECLGQGNVPLKHLNARYNFAGSSGAEAVFRGAAKSNVLAYVDMSYNGIGDGAAAAVAVAFKSSRSLLVVNLEGNIMTGDAASLIAPALASNRTLQDVSFSGNPLQSAGSALLVSALSRGGDSIDHLRLERTGFSSIERAPRMTSVLNPRSSGQAELSKAFANFAKPVHVEMEVVAYESLLSIQAQFDASSEVHGLRLPCWPLPEGAFDEPRARALRQGATMNTRHLVYPVGLSQKYNLEGVNNLEHGIEYMVRFQSAATAPWLRAVFVALIPDSTPPSCKFALLDSNMEIASVKVENVRRVPNDIAIVRVKSAVDKSNRPAVVCFPRSSLPQWAKPGEVFSAAVVNAPKFSGPGERFEVLRDEQGDVGGLHIARERHPTQTPILVRWPQQFLPGVPTKEERAASRGVSRESLSRSSTSRGLHSRGSSRGRPRSRAKSGKSKRQVLLFDFYTKNSVVTSGYRILARCGTGMPESLQLMFWNTSMKT